MKDLFEKLNEIITKYDSFIIMGHMNPDLDSLGSSLGLYEIVEHFNKKAYLFLDDSNLENYNSNINQAFERMEKEVICINKKTYKKVTGNVLNIIVDTHSKERLEYEDIVDCYDTIVLDHHIKNKNYIKDTKFLYIDSNLSSMSELITYYADYLKIDLDNVIATILLAGIEIDTNGFNLKTTDKTYNAAAILMNMGADTILKQELLKESKEDYIKRATFISNSFMVTENTAMCILHSKCTSMELAEVAEQLLTFEDVEQSFAIGKIEDNLIGVSAKSLGERDVSEIMKQMGGGGHTSNAATQVKDSTLKEVKQEIIKIITSESNK